MSQAALTRVRWTVFAALAAFAALNWVTLVKDPPLGRTVIAIGLAMAGFAALAAIGIRVPSRWRAALLAGLVVAAVVLAVALSLGLPAGLLLPSRWGELCSDLGGGIGSLGRANYPYAGGDSWSRLSLLLGLAPVLALSAALAFWPTGRPKPWRRRAALVVLLTAYAIAVTVSTPGDPLLRGTLLFALLAAWCLSPALGRRSLLLSIALIAAAALVAVPVAALLDGAKPWLDYHHWDWGGSPLGQTETFDWNHTYGPLDWSRDGRTLVQVRSAAPHYWATEVLDQFNGVGWVGSSTGHGVDLPLRREGAPAASLNRAWVFDGRFDVRDLSSPLLVGAGTVLTVSGVKGSYRTPQGVSVRGALDSGDSYSIRAYDPQPSGGQMRSSEGSYPHQLVRYTTVDVPHLGRLRSRSASLHSRPVALTLSPVTVPLRSDRLTPASPQLQASPYSRVYGLARRLAAGRPTAFSVVEAVQRYLKSKYTYSERPPARPFPLRAFLFRDRIGYCQQFSGAMALILRMDGIPSRVVGGFAPGERTKGGYVVSDFDAHSWIEVYFNRIGWVTFDPTPAASPALSRSSAVTVGGRLPSRRKFLSGFGPTPALIDLHGAGRGSAGDGSPLLVLAAIVAVAAAVIGPLAVFARRVSRHRALAHSALVEAQAVELLKAVSAADRPLGSGSTLRTVERRLKEVAGPRAADYAARLGKCRYGAVRTPAPGAGERRAVRRALSSGSGMRGRLRGLMLMPPGGPSPLTGPPPRS